MASSTTHGLRPTEPFLALRMRGALYRAAPCTNGDRVLDGSSRRDPASQHARGRAHFHERAHGERACNRDDLPARQRGVQGAVFRVYDQLGQQVPAAVISTNGVRVSFDVSQLCPGPYHIQVLDGRGKVRAATFIR